VNEGGRATHPQPLKDSQPIQQGLRRLPRALRPRNQPAAPHPSIIPRHSPIKDSSVGQNSRNEVKIMMSSSQTPQSGQGSLPNQFASRFTWSRPTATRDPQQGVPRSVTDSIFKVKPEDSGSLSLVPVHIKAYNLRWPDLKKHLETKFNQKDLRDLKALDVSIVTPYLLLHSASSGVMERGRRTDARAYVGTHYQGHIYCQAPEILD
jgi:hypothetical protein